MNALVEPEMFRALYRASQAGVRVDLIVRGMCSLRPGVRGLSENIVVRSVIGRFLEHNRACYFENGDSPALYLSSETWMDRTTSKRVQVAFPVLDHPFRKLQTGIWL